MSLTPPQRWYWRGTRKCASFMDEYSNQWDMSVSGILLLNKDSKLEKSCDYALKIQESSHSMPKSTYSDNSSTMIAFQ